MPVFPRFTSSFERDFSPLFRLLEDPSFYTAPSTSKKNTFQPSFDVYETEKEYVLEGELPGLAQENVSIEFTEGNTLLIRGKVERNKAFSSRIPNEEAPSAAIEDKKDEDVTMSGAIEEPERPVSPPKPTVEDANDNDWSEVSKPSETSEAEKPSESNAVSKASDNSEKKVEQQQAQQKNVRYWVSERSVGQFQRSFQFPGRVDEEGVKASLKDGLLKVVVPKRVQQPVKKITIQ